MLFGTKYSRMDQVKFFKGCPPQILIGPFLNTLSHLSHLLVLLVAPYKKYRQIRQR